MRYCGVQKFDGMPGVSQFDLMRSIQRGNKTGNFNPIKNGMLNNFAQYDMNRDGNLNPMEFQNGKMMETFKYQAMAGGMPPMGGGIPPAGGMPFGCRHCCCC
jgi:hypothetical protein